MFVKVEQNTSHVRQVDIDIKRKVVPLLWAYPSEKTSINQMQLINLSTPSIFFSLFYSFNTFSALDTKETFLLVACSWNVAINILLFRKR